MELLSLKKKGLCTGGIQPFLFVFTHRFYSRSCIFFPAKCRLKNEILTCRNKMYHELSKNICRHLQKNVISYFREYDVIFAQI